MNNNPCLVCQMLNEDKNNSFCVNCEKRINYVQQLEEQLNYSMSYTNTSIYARCNSPSENRMTCKLRMTFGC